MEIDLHTFLPTVYAITDALSQTHFAARKPTRPGKKPALSDREVLTLALLAHWQTARSEHAFGRYAAKQWQAASAPAQPKPVQPPRARPLRRALSAWPLFWLPSSSDFFMPQTKR